MSAKGHEVTALSRALTRLSGSGADATGAVTEKEFLSMLDTCVFLVKAAEGLQLDQTATVTALVFCHRFFSFRRKTCEQPRMLRSVMNVAHAVMNATTEPLGTGSRYRNLKECLINAEQTVLRVLQFELDVALPFHFLFNYAHIYNFSPATTHCAVRLVSDAFFDSAALQFPHFVLAAASLAIAVTLLEDNDGASKRNPKWWYACDTSDEDVASVAALLLRVYRHVGDRSPPLPTRSNASIQH